MQLTLNFQNVGILSSSDESIILQTCADHLRIPMDSCERATCQGCEGLRRNLQSDAVISIVAHQGIEDPTMGSIVQNFESSNLIQALVDAGIEASSIDSEVENIKLTLASDSESGVNLSSSLMALRENLEVEGVQLQEDGIEIESANDENAPPQENDPSQEIGNDENGPQENDQSQESGNNEDGPQENGPQENDQSQESGNDEDGPQESGPENSLPQANDPDDTSEATTGIIIGAVCGVIATAAVAGITVFALKKVKLARSQQKERSRSVEMPVKEGKVLESNLNNADKEVISFSNIAMEV
jgi:biotin operon repressor